MKDPLKIDPEEPTNRQASHGARDPILDGFRRLNRPGFPRRPELLPQFHRDELDQAVLTSNIIFGQLPGENWVLVYSQIGRRQLTWQQVMNLDIPANARFLVVDCQGEADVDCLHRYVLDIKSGRRQGCKQN